MAIANTPEKAINEEWNLFRSCCSQVVNEKSLHLDEYCLDRISIRKEEGISVILCSRGSLLSPLIVGARSQAMVHCPSIVEQSRERSPALWRRAIQISWKRTCSQHASNSSKRLSVVHFQVFVDTVGEHRRCCTGRIALIQLPQRLPKDPANWTSVS